MTKRTLFVLLAAIVLSAVLLPVSTVHAGSSRDYASAERPAPHKPECTIRTSRAYVVTCTDFGRDINDAFIIFRGKPMRHEITWTGEKATIIVYFPGFESYPYGQLFIWCVGDAQGNMTFGSYSFL